jgi:hypothetical protein
VTNSDRNRKVLLSIIIAALMVWGVLQFLASHPHWSPSKPTGEKEWSEFRATRESYTLDELCMKMDSFSSETEFLKWMGGQPISDWPKVVTCLRRRSL